MLNVYIVECVVIEHLFSHSLNHILTKHNIIFCPIRRNSINGLICYHNNTSKDMLVFINNGKFNIFLLFEAHPICFSRRCINQRNNEYSFRFITYKRTICWQVIFQVILQVTFHIYLYIYDYVKIFHFFVKIG